jgi:glutamate synthase (NADPH/NADH) small chain
MADPRGFLRFHREGPTRRPVEERLGDWQEVYFGFPPERLVEQAARCMDCGIPFCHEGCPLGNLIPEWNDLVYNGAMADAADRLHATNNFPEFTGRLCPAPCEGSCVLGIADDPVSIKQVEHDIAEWARGAGLEPVATAPPTGRRVAVIGSGPAGLAAAQQLTRAGHDVVVFERAEQAGGLLRYGVPEFKLEKAVIDARLAQMRAEGTHFELRTAIGADGLDEVPGSAAPGVQVRSGTSLAEEFDAVVLATGATRPRDLDAPGRSLAGVHFAMEYLRRQNLALEGALEWPLISAEGKHVIIIGGGDTGADCLGTVHRQGAASVRQLEILPEPPAERAQGNPWPTWPVILRTSAAHEEGGERMYSINTAELVGDDAGAVRAIRVQRVERNTTTGAFEAVPGEEHELPAELVLLALGFTGTEQTGVVADLGLEVGPRGTIAVDRTYATNRPGVFACGDAARGQSLVVWAIAEGRSAAAAVDRYLVGATELPIALRAGTTALA